MASSIEQKKKAPAILFLMMDLEEIPKWKRLKKDWIKSWISRRDEKGCFHQVFELIMLTQWFTGVVT